MSLCFNFELSDSISFFELFSGFDNKLRSSAYNIFLNGLIKTRIFLVMLVRFILKNSGDPSSRSWADGGSRVALEVAA